MGAGVLGITLVAGFLSFLGLYLSFEYWYDRFWTRGMKRFNEATIKLSEDLFLPSEGDEVWRRQLTCAGGFAFVVMVLSITSSGGAFLCLPIIVLTLIGQLLSSRSDAVTNDPLLADVTRMQASQLVIAVLVNVVWLGTLTYLQFPGFLQGVLSAAVTFYFAWRLPLVWYVQVVRPGRIKKFSNQMVDALTLMSNGLKSGLNVPQTLQIVVDEMPQPISQEFRLVLTENKIGLTFEKAFENLSRRIPSEDVSMFVTSVNILRETGGNIAETFDTIAKTIRERMKLQAKIGAMVAQGMMSAIIVGALPWGLGVMLYMIDPVRMQPLFTTPVGWAILMLILVLEAIGFFTIMKIVQIRV